MSILRLCGVEGGGTTWVCAIAEGESTNIVERASFETTTPAETLGAVEHARPRLFFTQCAGVRLHKRARAPGEGSWFAPPLALRQGADDTARSVVRATRRGKARVTERAFGAENSVVEAEKEAQDISGAYRRWLLESRWRRPCARTRAVRVLSQLLSEDS